MPATLARRLCPARLIRVVLILTLFGAAVVAAGPARPADASTTLGARAVAIAAQQRGKPYVWGADGPNAFDCSGLTQYVYRRLGHYLPHNAEMQRRVLRPESHAAMRKGDLVLFVSNGRAYHVGIYAGHWRIWHAPQPGDHVKLSKIWTHRFVVRRVT